MAHDQVYRQLVDTGVAVIKGRRVASDEHNTASAAYKVRDAVYRHMERWNYQLQIFYPSDRVMILYCDPTREFEPFKQEG